MAILPGRRLGPYEILSAIGAGGMGEVYKARDTRLDRIVAIKVLPAHLATEQNYANDSTRSKDDCQPESSHICTLYDTGHQDGIDYLVMEYLEGQTLAQRLQKGALPLNKFAVRHRDCRRARQGAPQGVTHRDLKPGNIM